MEQHFTAFPGEDVLTEAMANCRTAIEEAGASIVHGSRPDIRGNREQIVEVFQNLITNALKYRNSDEAPRIHIEANESGGQWQVAARDNGIGIDMQYADYIFRLFKRLHGSDTPGTGIGLAICKQVIEQHGGRIWVESAPGQGATFKFTLPAETHAEVPPQTQHPALDSETHSASSPLAGEGS